VRYYYLLKYFEWFINSAVDRFHFHRPAGSKVQQVSGFGGQFFEAGKVAEEG
jgi:hypothetical protein